MRTFEDIHRHKYTHTHIYTYDMHICTHVMDIHTYVDSYTLICLHIYA